FEKVQRKVEELEILPEDTWNINKCGCRIGVAKNQYIYTRHGRDVVIPYSTNRELIILVEYCSAASDVIKLIV
ncbi:hypothetical protein K469DRAFT_490095, partial [Zopfia rhizophila CBS 207.26]